MRWLASLLVLGALGAGAYFFLQGGLPTALGPADDANAPAPLPAAQAHAQPAPAAAPTPSAGMLTRQPVATPLVVIPEGRLTAIYTQQVPSMRDGKILFLATEAKEIKPGEPLPAGRPADYFEEEVVQLLMQRANKDAISPADLVALPTEDNKDTRAYSPFRTRSDTPEPNKMKPYPRKQMFRRLREGDEVRKGDLLALIDPALAVDEMWTKVAKLDSAEAEKVSSEKTRDETKQRLITSQDLYAKRAISLEELRGAQLTWDRYIYEAISKAQLVRVQANELRQSNTVLEQHAIRSEIGGAVKRLLKKPGEAVKQLESLLELQDNKRLRIEGRVDYHHRRHLRPGDRVFVEPTQSISPDQVLVGHIQEVTGVAVTAKGEVVSVSEDRTARVWDRKASQERLVLVHPVGVRAAACAPSANLCVTAAADGVARVWDLDGDGRAPAAELRDGHRGAVSCVAFSPDGRLIATGGEDRGISIWQVDGGKRLSQINGQQGHRGGVTSVQFLSKADKLYLVSAGRDYTMLVWELSADGTATRAGDLGRRGGNVTALGANGAAGLVLFDQDKELRLRSIPDGGLAGVLTSGGASNFTTMAQFSPDGKLILTAGGSDGRVQLWRAPSAATRASELRQLAWGGEGVTCGAFAPDGKFLVTGTKDRTVLVWPVPSKTEVETQFTAEVTLVENELDLNSRQVRVYAEIDNRWFELTERALLALRAEKLDGVDMAAVADRLKPLLGQEAATEKDFDKALLTALPPDYVTRVKEVVTRHAEKAGALLPGNTATLVVYPKK